MSEKVILDGLDKAVQNVLSGYSHAVRDQVKKDVRTVVRKCKSSIVAKSPELTGDYKAGWRSKIQEFSDGARATIYNETDYQLAHLLEFGHGSAGGTDVGAAPAHPHIQPAVESAEEELVRKAKEACRGK